MREKCGARCGWPSGGGSIVRPWRIRSTAGLKGCPPKLGIFSHATSRVTIIRSAAVLPKGLSMTGSIRLLSAAVLLLFAGTARADDWPQWMGPNRDAVWKETGIVEKFPEGGPKKLWSRPGRRRVRRPGGRRRQGVRHRLREAEPGAARAQTRSTPSTEIPGTERVLCLDAKTGKELWKHEYDCPYQISYAVRPAVHADGRRREGLRPRDDGRPVLPGRRQGQGGLVEGLQEGLQGRRRRCGGSAGHPLVYKNLLICLVGGKDSAAGRVRQGHRQGDVEGADRRRSPGTRPPTLIEAGGKPQLVDLPRPTAVAGLDPKTGTKHWSVPLKPHYAMSIMPPRQAGDVLFAGGNGDAVVAQAGPGQAGRRPKCWRGKRRHRRSTRCNMTPFVDGDTIYGVDSQRPAPGGRR